MLRLNNISKTFNNVKVLDSVSIEFKKSSLSIIAGADGAGKTTLFKIIAGLYSRDEGSVIFKGENIDDDFSPVSEKSGYMPEKFSLYPDLSVEENLNFFGSVYGVSSREFKARADDLLKRTGMYRFKGRRAGRLSGGMKQKLALMSILFGAPELIILDEPTTGVDPLSRIEFFEIIKTLKSEGSTVLISTPYLDEAEEGDYVAFLKNGRIIRQGGIVSLKENFPGDIYRALPVHDLFKTYRVLDTLLPGEVYLRGEYIYIMRDPSGKSECIEMIKNIERIEPRLEDMYIFFERENEKSGN